MYLDLSKVGNKNYLKKVSKRKNAYREATGRGKTRIRDQLIEELQREGFTFVVEVANGWFEASPKAVQAKVSQALRERSPNMVEEEVATDDEDLDPTPLEGDGAMDWPGSELEEFVERFPNLFADE
jgi:hypothetical protein